MTCKIERLRSGESAVVLHVCGRIQVEHMSIVKDLIERESSRVALDLKEVTLVDRDAATLLANTEQKGVELRNCPAFLREWIDYEQQCIVLETPNPASGAITHVNGPSKKKDSTMSETAGRPLRPPPGVVKAEGEEPLFKAGDDIRISMRFPIA